MYFNCVAKQEEFMVNVFKGLSKHGLTSLTRMSGNYSIWHS